MPEDYWPQQGHVYGKEQQPQLCSLGDPHGELVRSQMNTQIGKIQTRKVHCWWCPCRRQWRRLWWLTVWNAVDMSIKITTQGHFWWWRCPGPFLWNGHSRNSIGLGEIGFLTGTGAGRPGNSFPLESDRQWVFFEQRCHLSLFECGWKGASGEGRGDHLSEHQGREGGGRRLIACCRIAGFLREEAADSYSFLYEEQGKSVS